MSQEWDVMEFFKRFRDGEFDNELGETLDVLTSEQFEDFRRLLLMPDGKTRIAAGF